MCCSALSSVRPTFWLLKLKMLPSISVCLICPVQSTSLPTDLRPSSCSKRFSYIQINCILSFFLNNKSSLQTCSCRYTHAAKSQPAPDLDLNHTIVRHTVGRGNSAVNTCFAETEINFTRTPLVETVCRLQDNPKDYVKKISVCLLLILSKLPRHFGVCAWLPRKQSNKHFTLAKAF